MGKQKKPATKKRIRPKKPAKNTPAFEPAAGEAGALLVESPGPAAELAPPPPARDANRSRRRGGRGRGRAKTDAPPADGQPLSEAAAPANESKTPSAAVWSAAPPSVPQVETTGEAVVIRFGATLPPPPAPRSPANEAARSPAAPPPEPQMRAVVIEPPAARPAVSPPESIKAKPVMEEKRAAPRESTAPRAPAAPPAKSPAGPAPEMDENDLRRLSPSQKRRLRRKRRAQLLRQPQEGETDEATAGETVAATEEAPPLVVTEELEPAPAEKEPEALFTEEEPEPVSAGAGVESAFVEEEDEEEPDEPTAVVLDTTENELPETTLLTEVEEEGEGVEPARPSQRGPEPSETEPRRGRGRGRRRRGGRGRGRGRGEVTLEPAEAAPGESEVFEEASETLIDLTQESTEEAAPETERGAPAARKEMIINVSPKEECRICILKDGKLEEIYLERASAESHVGNIYKGVVTNVEPSIQAAFIDFGLAKNGFLHISDLHPKYFPNGGGQTENVGRKIPRSHRPPIQKCLRRGQEVIVQVTREGIGTKGPTLTTYASIPGRYLVMMPGMRRLGVSRKIENEEARDQIRDCLSDIELPEGVGFIARTAAQGRPKRELQSDLQYLLRLWKTVEERRKSEKAPAELYRESDLVIRTIRDVFTGDVERIVVDDPDVANRAREFLSLFNPRARDAVQVYDAPEPIFHKYGIEAELERLHSRHVPLRSGGSLVIDQTEALVAIDVNSGRFRTEDDAEATAFKINMEAADEIPRQLRLRDLGGVIVCDFIDMRLESHRREVERRLVRNLKEHKERVKVLRMSEFGIIEMTRQRQRASLTRSVYQDCHHCRGTGLVKTAESVVLDIVRLLQLAMTREQIQTIEVKASFEVAHLLLNRKRALLHDMETRNRRSISIRGEAGHGLDQIQIDCYDARGRLVPHT